MLEGGQMFVGWDWASATHDVTVLDDAGAVVDRWALQHTEQDLAAALGRLARLGEPAALPVTIERSGGLVVERLVAAGHPVVPVHPTAVWAARPRWGASGAKSDAGDSYKLADYLRTDGHRLRRLDSPDAGLQELQALVRLREDHLRARTAASNQLGVLLEAHWPGPKAVFYRLASPIALAFLADYPTPQAAARLGQERMASLLPTAQLPRRQATGGAAGQAALGTDRPGRHPGGHPGDPCPRPSPAAAHPAWDHHRPRGEDRHARRQPPARQAARVAARCRHHQPRPTARRGRADPDRVSSAEQAAAECGAAPVTKASGKTNGVYFRWAANRRARKALTAYAHNSRLASPWAGRLYADARARGKRNPTPPASSRVPGYGSSGPAGSTPPPTTPLCTPQLFQLQPRQLDSGN
jgi:transposase